MSETKQEWQYEQQRVDEVVDKIKEKALFLEQHVGIIKSDVVQIRKDFWDDVTVNVDNVAEAVETYASIKQQAEMLSERERSHRHSHNQLKTLKRLQQSPYFGRIDFAEEGEKADSIYLGIGSFFDEETEQFLVYDWRAPISSLYYDYSIGPAQYEAPDGIVTGDLKVKRQFIVRNGRIESMFDTGVTIGDVMLQEVLGKHANTQMKNIVATIQKEQNRIIRNEKSRLLVVQGAAGSGKTSAALQRVAYLLYCYRETLRADQMILFSPNPMFNSYVSTVLPELGEENMQQTTFQEYLEHQLGYFELEDPFTQIEYVLTAADETGYAARVEGIQYKATIDFMLLIDRYAAYLKQKGIIFKDVTFRGKVLISAEQVKEQFYASTGAISIPSRMEQTAKWLRAELKKLEKLERKKPWVEEEMELLDKDAFVQAHQKLQRKKRYSEETFDDFEREQKLLAASVVRKYFKPLYKSVKKLRFIDVPAVYRQLFTDAQFALQFTSESLLPKGWDEICLQTAEKISRSYLAYEDATPYLYLKEQLEGFQKNTSVRHVFIDEAQDYSPFQFAFLKRLFPLSKMTVLGDLNQAIHVQSKHTGLFTLSALYGEEHTETIELKRSYRSTKQIIEFTRQLISGGEEIEVFDREGSKPIIEKAMAEQLVDKAGERIRELQGAGHKTIAVICKTARESKEVYGNLKEKMQLRLVTKETSSFESGVLVIPAYLAKGVEFDAVIIYNASEGEYGEKERKLFYTACTRAMHELHIYFIDSISSLILEASPDTYISYDSHLN